MLSGIEFSGDRVAYKLFPLAPNLQWWAMVAGDDVTHIIPVLEAANLALVRLSPEMNTLANVERIVTKAYHDVRLQYADDLVLAPIGLTMEALWRNPQWQKDLVEKLGQVDLGCQILVAGFDRDGDGHIFTVEHPGIARNHDLAGWAAIGSGAFSAVSTLLLHSVNYEMEVVQVLYHVCEAKFMAESASGVGKYTIAKVISPKIPTDPAADLSQEVIAAIRDDWERDGRPRIPKSTISGLRKLLYKKPTGLNQPSKATNS